MCTASRVILLEITLCEVQGLAWGTNSDVRRRHTHPSTCIDVEQAVLISTLNPKQHLQPVQYLDGIPGKGMHVFVI
jgi:hypothetical protein